MNAPLLKHLFQEDLYYFTTPVVVVLGKPWETYSEDAQSLLQKILNSVGVHIDSVQLVVQPQADLQALQAYLPARVLIFGADTDQAIPFYEETPAQGFTVVRADDLSLLDDQKKKNLWLALRKMFGI